MAVGFSKTNKPINPRGNDQSPKGYNRAALYSGKALDFDGVNDLLTISDGINSLVGGEITFTAWVRLDAVSGYPCIISNKVNDTNGFAFLVNPTGNQLFWQYDGAAYQIESGGELTLGELYFVCATYDGSNLKTYINGVESVTKAAPSKGLTATGDLDLYIGRQNTATGYWNGLISGLRAFNTALTAAQVADLYNNPEKIVPTGVADSALKLWLPMMEGAGTTAYDGSPAGFVEDIVTGFTNGTTYPLDSFASNDDDITTAIKTSGFGGCVSNGHYYTNGQKVKVKFTYQKNSGDDLRVLFSSLVTGAGTAKSDIQYISASGEFEHIFTMTADGIAYLQLGTGGASDSIDAVITDVYVSPHKSPNHGTISGATWTHGIGSPVAQTAVIDWNKGTNILGSTNIFDAYWTKSGGTLTTGIEAPDGTNTAFKFERDDASSGTIYNVAPSGLSSTNYRYVYAKLPSGTGSAQLLSHNTNTNNTFTITDEWQRFELNSAPNTAPTNFYIVDFRAGVGVDEIHLWAPQAAAGTDESVFVPTIGNNPQPNDVLLPQGLTSGRDITGVNLFENVRKQGALNLDGNSWAEVHDNASLDITPNITLEAWIKCGDELNAVYDHIFVKPTSTTWTSPYGTYVLRLRENDVQWWFESVTNAKSYSVSLSGWNHLAVTKEGASEILYINGAQVDTKTGSATMSATIYDLLIGTRTQYATNEMIANQLAQPRIYNRALTAEEVLRNYNSEKNTYQ